MKIAHYFMFVLCNLSLTLDAQTPSKLQEKYVYFHDSPTFYDLTWNVKKGKLKSGEFNYGTRTRAHLEVLKVMGDTITGTLTFQGDDNLNGFVAFVMDTSFLYFDVFNLKTQKRLFIHLFAAGERGEFARQCFNQFQWDKPAKIDSKIVGKWRCEAYFEGISKAQKEMKPLDKAITLDFHSDGSLEGDNFWLLPVKEHRQNGLLYRNENNTIYFKINSTDQMIISYTATGYGIDEDVFILMKGDSTAYYFTRIK
jgi:hypothetical protein